MHLFKHLFLKLLPLALIGGAGYVLFASFGSVASDRFGSINYENGPVGAYSTGGFESSLAAQTAAKSGYVREALDWSQIEPSDGVYNWVTPVPYASLFASEKAAGFKVVAVLSGGPTYFNGSSIDFLIHWAKFVQSAVDTLGDQVDVWEIGTQINSTSGMSAFITPTTPTQSTTPDPTLYAQMLIVADKIIKTADPNDEVWMGSLVSAAAQNCALNPLTFLLQVNGSKGFDSIDSIEYVADRGALSPEASLTAGSIACASSLPSGVTTLSGEVKAMQDLAANLGGKTLRIEGLGWNNDELSTLATGRSTASDQILADELTRATVILAANNGIGDVFWQADAGSSTPAEVTLKNLNSVLAGARLESQPQGQTGSVYEYRFTKGSQWIIIAWRAQDGDTPIPVTLSNLSVNSLTAYAVDAPAFTEEFGTKLTVSNGSTILYLNERPVVFLGKTADITKALQQDGENQTSLWKLEIKQAANHQLNNLKLEMKNALKDMFNSAKQKAVDWGKEKINEVLN